MAETLPRPGETLDGTYRLVGYIDKGGFGIIFRARQLALERDVAIKMLVCPEDRRAVMAERFRREVDALRRLHHPNTILILDYRELPNGLPYYVMEHLQGVNLHEIIQREGPQPARRVKHIVRQILKSLAEAHDHHIIHRDLKPANIMLVTMHGEEDFVKVLDFGIAKKIGVAKESSLTEKGKLVGTLNYMSPEQLLERDLSPSTDLYTLGQMTLELLMGRPYFEGKGQREIVEAITSRHPLPFPDAAREHPLAPWCARALQKHPTLRFQSASEALAALEAITDQELADYEARWAEAPLSGDEAHTATQPQFQAPATEVLDRPAPSADPVEAPLPEGAATVVLPSAPSPEVVASEAPTIVTPGVMASLDTAAPGAPPAAAPQAQALASAESTPTGASADASPAPLTDATHDEYPKNFGLILAAALGVPIVLVVLVGVLFVLVMESG